MRYYGTVFAKIFVEDGGKLVLDSVKEDIDQPFAGRIEVCKKERGKDGSLHIVPYTMISPPMAILSSPEAKALLQKVFDLSNPKLKVSRFDGTFEFLDANKRGDENPANLSFAFRPNKLGETRCVLDPAEEVTLSVRYGFSYKVFDYLRLADNEFLKNLDITSPVRVDDVTLIEE